MRFRIGSRRYRHRFLVVPNLDTPVLLGVDLWSRLQLTLPPPPRQGAPTLRDVCQVSTGLTAGTGDEKQRLREFLNIELNKFEKVQGPTDQAQHHIHLTDARPIKQRYRPRNPAMQVVIDAEIRQMEADGIIEPSKSAWSSPVVVVRKKDGSRRFCIDFRRLNAVTEKDAYLLPHIAATLDKLRGAKYLSTLDLKSGYWQIPLTPESRPLTTFTVPGRGLMQFRVMPFGLHSAPATFQRLIDNILGPELEPHVFVYLDDIIIVSQTFEEHLDRPDEVFRRLREAQLRINTDC